MRLNGRLQLKHVKFGLVDRLGVHLHGVKRVMRVAIRRGRLQGFVQREKRGLDGAALGYDVCGLEWCVHDFMIVDRVQKRER